MTDEFLESISINTVLPKEIILIDNGSSKNIKSLVKKYKNLPINYIRHEVNTGVNKPWNDGIRLAKTKFISVLNNDIILNKYFFEKIIEVMKSPDVGIVVPKIVKDKNLVNKTDNSPVKVIKNPRQKRREGCAFTIRKEITNKIKPIPIALKTYCGDYYLFNSSEALGYKYALMSNNYVFHYGGQTVNQRWPDGETTRVEEKKYWQDIKKGIK